MSESVTQEPQWTYPGRVLGVGGGGWVLTDSLDWEGQSE